MLVKTAYLGLGANLGDKMQSLRTAIRLIEGSGSCQISAISSLYATSPVGIEDQPEFVNAVIEVKTTLSPPDLLGLCNSVENEMGRERTIRWGPRVIDIDVLLYEGVSSDNENLTIPHPRMMERAFVLIPLAEIAPDLMLSGGLTASEAVGRVDQSGVQLIQDRSWSQ